MSITGKKKLALKTNDSGSSAMSAGEAASPAIPPGLMAPRLGLEKRESFTFHAIIALCAVAMFIGLLVMQWSELTYYAPAFPVVNAISAPESVSDEAEVPAESDESAESEESAETD